MRGPALGGCVAVVLSVLALLTPVASSADTGGAEPPRNPHLGPNGTSTMHGDSASSDTTPHAGSGQRPVDVRYIPLAGACPTVLVGADGYPVVLCTSLIDRAPTVYLLDPDSGAPLATLRLNAGELLGGVYAYLDAEDLLVAVDGDGDLLRIGHRRGAGGAWELYIAQRTPIGAAGVVSVMPDWQGRVWFATADAGAGYVDPVTGRTALVELPDGERVSNSISTAPQETAVVTDYALYLLAADRRGVPRVLWRQPYDRGSARKPGQLSWGSGATPTFFGPRTGTEYVTITDNATPQPRLLVFDTRTGQQRCALPVLSGAADGTENSAIAFGRSVFVASTYGYPYPAYPDDAGPSEPESAPFAGGMTRVELRPDGTGCDVRWQNTVRSAAVPRLSLADGYLYTITRDGPLDGGDTTPLDSYRTAVIDQHTGALVAGERIGAGAMFDTLQMVGTIDAHGVQYQGTLTGVVRIAAR